MQLFLLQRLEERVGELEDNAVSQPKGPEPILTCVQCLADYKESENGGIHGDPCKVGREHTANTVW